MRLILAVTRGMLIWFVLCLCFSVSFGQEVTQHDNGRKADFASLVIEVAKSVVPDTKGTYYPDRDEVRIVDAKTGEVRFVVFLDNLFNQTKDDSRSEKRSFVKKFLSEAMRGEKKTTKAELIQNLQIRPRTRRELAYRKYLFGGVTENSVVKPYGEIIAEIVVDMPNSLSPLMEYRLNEVHLSRQKALTIALQHTKKNLSSQKWVQVDTHIWGLEDQDDYSSARMIVGVDEMKLPVQGDWIAYIPSHGTVLITDHSDSKTIDKLLKLGDELAGDYRAFSWSLWKYENKNWRVWKPSRQNSAYPVVKNQYLLRDVRENEEAAAILNNYFEQKNAPEYVAKQLLYKDRNSGRRLTLAVYPIGVKFWLPKSDNISLVMSDEADPKYVGMLSWKNFVSIIGERNLITFPDPEIELYAVPASLSPEVRKKLIRSARIDPG